MKALKYLPGVAMALLLSGCSSLMIERQEDVVRRDTETEKLKVELYRLREKVDGMAVAQEQLQTQVQELRSAQAGGGDIGVRMAKVEADLRRLENGLEPLRQDIVSSLSKRVSDIVRAQGASASAAQTGREHVVKPGESLARIAAAYGVKSETIIKANGIKNPNSLRAGQKLFIPE